MRVVTISQGLPDLPADMTDGGQLQAHAAKPTFEDAFISRLKKEQQGGNLAFADVTHKLPRTATDNGVVIEVKNLQRRFGDFYAVKDVSFNVKRGEVFGLLGSNGAGKSTTFRMLCGLLPVSAGEVHVAGLDLRHSAARVRGRLGYMAQRFSLYVDLTVLQNLSFFASAYGLDRARGKERIDWALEAFELTGLRQYQQSDLPLGLQTTPGDGSRADARTGYPVPR